MPLRPSAVAGGLHMRQRPDTIHAVALDDTAVARLARDLRGELIRPGDAAYEGARRVWNGMIDRRPALIVRCATPDDVIAAVGFARAHEIGRASCRERG